MKLTMYVCVCGMSCNLENKFKLKCSDTKVISLEIVMLFWILYEKRRK